MNNWHPWQLKKSKSWGPFWSYQLNSTANPAHLHQNWPNWQCCLADSSKMAPRIFIFSILLGAEYLSYVKSIAAYAPKSFGYYLSVIAYVDTHPYSFKKLDPIFKPGKQPCSNLQTNQTLDKLDQEFILELYTNVLNLVVCTSFC